MRNSTRRSRNIGTAKQGHGRDNAMAIPFPFEPKALLFYERLGDCTRQTRTLNGQEITFIVEKTRKPNVHACSVDDIARVLSCIPAADLKGLEFVVLRQPKRKEEILSSVWGRYHPYGEFDNRFGGVIILEAMDLSRALRWRKPQDAIWLEELEKLRDEGHEITETPKRFEIRSTLAAVRQTQLFGTVPHEVGHHVQAMRNRDVDRLPTSEKERFAETYARDFMRKWGELLNPKNKKAPI